MNDACAHVPIPISPASNSKASAAWRGTTAFPPARSRSTREGNPSTTPQRVDSASACEMAGRSSGCRTSSSRQRSCSAGPGGKLATSSHRPSSSLPRASSRNAPLSLRCLDVCRGSGAWSSASSVIPVPPSVSPRASNLWLPLSLAVPSDRRLEHSGLATELIEPASPGAIARGADPLCRSRLWECASTKSRSRLWLAPTSSALSTRAATLKPMRRKSSATLRNPNRR